MIDQSVSDLIEQKKNGKDLKAAKEQVAQYEKSTKAGTRVMTREQQQLAVQSAKDAQISATDEARQKRIPDPSNIPQDQLQALLTAVLANSQVDSIGLEESSLIAVFSGRVGNYRLG